MKVFFKVYIKLAVQDVIQNIKNLTVRNVGICVVSLKIVFVELRYHAARFFELFQGFKLFQS